MIKIKNEHRMDNDKNVIGIYLCITSTQAL